ncbi:AbiJ-NTD4 domain-containing protein, partial [Acinetobacter pittii]|uniref:AbiJ-NTD4 domain-containing protein n=1 Tax=Acinetobacter pittii TaxID=48296 RepID=UPI00064563EE
MSIFDLFSKRQKKLRGEIPDVYQYEDIPKTLKIQIIHIIRDVLGNESSPSAHQVYEFIHKTLCKEYGRFSLGEHYESDHKVIFNFLLNEKKHEYCLDVIEIFFKMILAKI